MKSFLSRRNVRIGIAVLMQAIGGMGDRFFLITLQPAKAADAAAPSRRCALPLNGLTAACRCVFYIIPDQQLA